MCMSLNNIKSHLKITLGQRYSSVKELDVVPDTTEQFVKCLQFKAEVKLSSQREKNSK